MVPGAYVGLYVFQDFAPKNGRVGFFVLIHTANSEYPLHSLTPEMRKEKHDTPTMR